MWYPQHQWTSCTQWWSTTFSSLVGTEPTSPLSKPNVTLYIMFSSIMVSRVSVRLWYFFCAQLITIKSITKEGRHTHRTDIFFLFLLLKLGWVEGFGISFSFSASHAFAFFLPFLPFFSSALDWARTNLAWRMVDREGGAFDFGMITAMRA